MISCAIMAEIRRRERRALHQPKLYIRSDDWQKIKALAARRDRLRERRNSALSVGLGCTVTGAVVLVVTGTWAPMVTGLVVGAAALVLQVLFDRAQTRLVARMDELEEVQ
jgi:Flp pilus assembly protein TadB